MDELQQLLMVDDAEIHAISAVKTERYVPSGMRKGILNANLALGCKSLVEQPLFAQSLARYVVYVADPNVTFEVFRYLIYWSMRYTWDEAYCVAVDEEYAYACMKLSDDTLGVIASQSPGTHICYEMANELRYSLTRYEPTYQHCLRLLALSQVSGVCMSTLKRIEMDIRLRRERFTSPDYSIRTRHGRDYLFVRYTDTALQRYEGCIVNVGASCIVCGKDNHCNPIVCSRCGEAAYCCNVHRRRDITRHRTECGVSM